MKAVIDNPSLAIRTIAVHDWEIQPAIKERCFANYYILQWDGAWLEKHVSNGTIMHDQIRYRVCWITSPQICYGHPEVSLSFRRIYGQEEGYVLIKILGRNK
jgi:hypothetical protein